MKRLFILLLLLITLATTPSLAFAQGMMGYPNSSTNISSSDIKTQQQEEKEGKDFLDKLKNKTITCQSLKDNDFEKIGEYFMGQAIGDTSRHIAMNNMMKAMMGESGEEQMHVAWGKSGSGCDTSSQGTGFLSMMGMMQMMGGGGNPMMGYGGWNNMMGGWNGFGVLGWLPMLFFWILIILGVIALLRYLGQSRKHEGDKTPLEMLKERYAKGEINKKEFEEMKKDLR